MKNHKHLQSSWVDKLSDLLSQLSPSSICQSKVQTTCFMRRGRVTKWLGLRGLDFYFSHFSFFSSACHLISANSISSGLLSSETTEAGQSLICCLHTANTGCFEPPSKTENCQNYFFHNEGKWKNPVDKGSIGKYQNSPSSLFLRRASLYLGSTYFHSEELQKRTNQQEVRHSFSSLAYSSNQPVSWWGIRRSEQMVHWK